jgi:AcrR family transcriptional regulator
MRGRKPVRPLAEVADAAMGVFADKGFRPAGISDVAAALGLSHGAVYTYVEGKQALLYLALLRATRPDAVTELSLPVGTPPVETIVAVMETWVKEQEAFGIGVRQRPDERSAADELALVVDTVYDFIDGNQLVLTLVARCAEDLPELGQWYFVERRRGMVAEIGEFLRTRIAAGTLRPVPDVPAAARFIVETIAWFAMHRHGDPDSAMLDDETCRRTVHDLVVAAFLPNPDTAVETG